MELTERLVDIYSRRTLDPKQMVAEYDAVIETFRKPVFRHTMYADVVAMRKELGGMAQLSPATLTLLYKKYRLPME